MTKKPTFKYKEEVGFYDSIHTSISIKIPRKTYEKLAALGNEKGYSIPTLCCFAIHNEFESDSPFELAIPWPEETFEEYKYIEEAKILLDFIKQFGVRGATIEMLLLLKDSTGLSDKKIIMAALKELMYCDMVEYIPAVFKKLKVPPGSNVYRAKHVDWTKVKKIKYRNEDQIAKDFNAYHGEDKKGPLDE